MTAQVIGIVVVNFGSHSLLARHLSPLDLDRIAARVVIVDNFHSAAELSAVADLCNVHGWELVSSSRNLGFGAGMNLGVARAIELGCDAFLLLNPDARISTESVEKLAQMSRSEPRSLISPVILRPDGSVWFSGSTTWPASGRVGKVDGTFVSGPDTWLTGACLMVHGHLWVELGGFADEYFLYWEDIDLSRRCVELGGTLRVAGDITAVHEVGGTQSSGHGASAKSSTYYYYNCRNRLLFASAHLPTKQLWSWLIRTPAQSAVIVLRGGRRQLVRSPRPILSGIGGALAGTGLALLELARRAVRSPRSRWRTATSAARP